MQFYLTNDIGVSNSRKSKRIFEHSTHLGASKRSNTAIVFLHYQQLNSLLLIVELCNNKKFRMRKVDYYSSFSVRFSNDGKLN